MVVYRSGQCRLCSLPPSPCRNELEVHSPYFASHQRDRVSFKLDKVGSPPERSALALTISESLVRLLQSPFLAVISEYEAWP